MTRDLPKNVPPAVLAAAHAAIERSTSFTQDRQAAKKAYEALRRQYWTNQEAVQHMELDAKAQALLDWGAMLQERLPIGRLDDRFRSLGGQGLCLSVVRHEIVLPPHGDFPGGRLATELEIALDVEEGLFRHHEWFEGYRMAGGGLLSTATGLRHSLQPEALDQIHRLIAEGQNWRHIEISLNDLVDSFKDR